MDMHNKAKYNEVNADQNKRIEMLREFFSAMYVELELFCKPGRETNLAFTKLEEAQFWAIKGISRETSSTTLN